MTWILIAAALIGLVSFRPFSDERRGKTAIPESLIDGLWMIALAIAGVVAADAIHTHQNPSWYPVGQDWREFVVLALDIQSGGM